jgi:hypothetical protein
MRRPVSARAVSAMVLPPRAAVLTQPAYQGLVQVQSAEQAQSRQVERAAQLGWFRHGRLKLGRSAGLPPFVAQLGLGSAIEREVCPRNWMQRQAPVARMRAMRLVSARVMLLRVTAVPVDATWAMPPRMTAGVVKAARAILTRTRAAATLVTPRVSPARVERPAQAKALPSACRAGP